ncbi:hypothetical protein VTJ04DRAFT_1132 [Mycothermus thermophilus]|uniref:uncharacterized protein n=1 Tax=Humicola insolens TaxID=85995 RepID=UPI0037428F8F
MGSSIEGRVDDEACGYGFRERFLFGALSKVRPKAWVRCSALPYAVLLTWLCSWELQLWCGGGGLERGWESTRERDARGLGLGPDNEWMQRNFEERLSTRCFTRKVLEGNGRRREEYQALGRKERI